MAEIEQSSNTTSLDVRIMRHLARKGFTTEREMAKALAINQTTLNYKLKKFKSKKIILGFKYQLNYDLLGLNATAFCFFVLKKGAISHEAMDTLNTYPEVYGATLITGAYDICAKLHGRSTEHLAQTILKIEKECKHLFRNSEPVHVIKSFKMHDMLLPERPQPYDFSLADLQILSEKTIDPDISLNRIATKLKLHRNTVSARWKKMWDDNVLIKKSVIFHPNHLAQSGSHFRALCLIDAEIGSVEDLARELCRLPEIHELYHVTAQHDLLAVVYLPDIDDFTSFHTKLNSDSAFLKTMVKTLSRIILTHRSRPHRFENEINYLIEKQKKEKNGNHRMSSGKIDDTL